MIDFTDDENYEPCDHESADIDMLTGRMSCHCGFSKWLTSEEFQTELKLQAMAQEEWDRLCEQESAAQTEQGKQG